MTCEEGCLTEQATQSVVNVNLILTLLVNIALVAQRERHKCGEVLDKLLILHYSCLSGSVGYLVQSHSEMYDSSPTPSMRAAKWKRDSSGASFNERGVPFRASE